MSVAEIYQNARAVEPFLRENADAIEDARTLPPLVAQRMRDAGMFRIAMPMSWGGSKK